MLSWCIVRCVCVLVLVADWKKNDKDRFCSCLNFFCSLLFSDNYAAASLLRREEHLSICMSVYRLSFCLSVYHSVSVSLYDS